MLKYKKLQLKNVVLVAVASTRIDETIAALNHCLRFATFKDTYFFSHDVRVPYFKSIPEIKSIEQYSEFMVKSLPDLIQADYCLIIQSDGFIINPFAWDDEFLNYDYIGAPWPQHNHICGNGGFSLRSKKFLAMQKIICKKIKVDLPEDHLLCITLRKQFEKLGCRYAPKEIAYKFSTEIGDWQNNKSFGFHDLKIHVKFATLMNKYN